MSEIRYSIKDLENFTQIKAHTIRIWEQRYGLLSPQRTDTNIRYYSEDDLKKILNINLLYTTGTKISKIAALNDQEIIEASRGIILQSDKVRQSDIDKLTINILEFKSRLIREFLKNKLLEVQLEDLYNKTIIPLLKKIGELWQVNSINIIHEHYFSNILKEFLITSTNNLGCAVDPLKQAVLFLHDDEEHEFSILMQQYILKKAGYTCHYFGQKSPVEEMKTAVDQLKPQIVCTNFTAKISEKNFRKVEDVLIEISKNSLVLISGKQIDNFDFKFSKKLRYIKSINQLKSILD